MKLKKKASKLNAETLLVTVDIAKRRHFGYARSLDGSELDVFAFNNTRKGFDYFLSKVESFRDRKGLRRLVFGIESTGNYGEALLHYLYKRGHELIQVNPMHVKRVKEIRGNSQDKSDLKDPKVIADIISLNNYLTVIIPEGHSAELRRLAHLREQKQTDLRRVYNRMESQMTLIFPEFLQIMKPLTTKSALYLLRHFPTPQAIKGMSIADLTGILERVSRKRLGRDRAERLYRASMMSVGIGEGQESIVAGIQLALDEIRLHERQLCELEQKIERTLIEIPYSKYLLSVKGIGALSAGVLIGEVGDFRKYRSKQELLKLAGLNLYGISSGEHNGLRHITKRGRHLLRKILFYAALNMSKKGGIFHAIYQSHLKKGMKKIKAITALSRKLIGILFALVRDGKHYDQGVHELAKAA